MLSRKTAIITVTLLISGVTALEAQRYNTGGTRTRNRSRLVTPYLYHYGYGARSPYAANPYRGYSAPLAVTPALPPVSGPVEKYSELEYGEIVKMTIEAARANSPSGSGTQPRQSIVDQTTVSLTGETAYEPVATKVSDILDRGIMLLPTGEELRLRGVIMPSTTERNEVSRIYAREGVQVLRDLTQGKEIYAVLDEPLRDSAGRLLGTIVLADGTELNRKMLEMGYGSLRPEDFAEGVDYSDLSESQENARSNRIGIWSK